MVCNYLNYFIRGNDFRPSYSYLGQVRSLVDPKVPIMTLTATATNKIRDQILRTLCMTDTVSIVMPSFRGNITYFASRIKHSDFTCFDPIIQNLKDKHFNAEKVVIFCRNVKTVGQLYAHFIYALSEDSENSLNCIVAMFHRSTVQANKEHILITFPKKDSTIRLLIATVAFGMGINIPDIRVVINYGSPSTIESFAQESGRAGRDGDPAYSILLYNGYSLGKGLTEESMYSQVNCCKSKYLMEYFTLKLHGQDSYFDIPAANTVMNTHDCCGLCRDACSCKNCPVIPWLLSIVGVNAFGSDVDEKPDNYRAVNEDLLVNLKYNFEDYQSQLIEEMNLSCDEVSTSFSSMIMDEVLSNCGYLLTVEDVFTHTSITDDDMAEDIVLLLNELIPLD